MRKGENAGAAPLVPLVPSERALIVGVTTLAAALGTLPFALFVERWWVLGFAAGLAFLVSLFTSLPYRSEARSRPTVAEVLLGTWSTAGFIAVLTALCLMVQAGLALVWRAVGWVIGKLGGGLPGDPVIVGLWPSLAVLLVAGWLTFSLSADGLTQKLYPEHGASSSSLARLLRRRRSLGWRSAVSLALLALILWLTEPGSGWSATWVTLWWIVLAPSLMSDTASETSGERKAKEVIVELAEAAGYEVQVDPSSGRPETDALVKDLDVLALGPLEGFAIEVKSKRQKKPVEWYEASHLRTVVWALEQWLEEEGRPRSVRPLLVLVDSREAESLERFLAAEPLAVARTTSEALNELDGADSERLRAAALEILSLPAVHEPRHDVESQEAGD